MIRNVIMMMVAIGMVKFIWVTVELIWLPTSGVEYVNHSYAQTPYYRISFVPVKRVPSTSKGNVERNINDIKLLALYSASDGAVVTVSYKNGTKVLALGDEIDGFVLHKVGNDFATFSKNDTLYTVELVKSKQSTKSSIQSTLVSNKDK